MKEKAQRHKQFVELRVVMRSKKIDERRTRSASHEKSERVGFAVGRLRREKPYGRIRKDLGSCRHLRDEKNTAKF